MVQVQIRNLIKNNKKFICFMALTTTVTILGLFVFNIVLISGDSMVPAYTNHDIVLVKKIYGTYSNLQKGDIVIALEPSQNTKVVKRIGGCPGDSVEYKGNRILLEEGEYFLLGDNSSVSYDSREFGPVKSERIIGVVIADLYKKGS